MKQLFLVLFQLAAWSAPVVPVIVQGGPDTSAFFVGRAKFLAAELFEEAGVRIRWISRAEPGAIVITLEDFGDGPLGAARLYEGTNIRISLPRLRSIAREHRLAELLAYVMVHEIAHILQAVDIHAPEGIMKAKWGRAEFGAIFNRTLRFTPADVEMIQAGIERRKNILAGVSIFGTNFALRMRRTLR